MDFKEYVVGIIAVAVYLICLILHSIKFIDNRWLPLIAGALGIIFNIWYQRGVDFSVFVGGLASGLSAVGIDQTIDFFKETFRKEDENDGEDN